MGMGVIDIIVSSPPYERSSVAEQPSGSIGQNYRSGKIPKGARVRLDGTKCQTYGNSKGQLAFMKGTQLEEIVGKIKLKPVKTDQWHRCFEDSWDGFITEDSISHPAKFSRGLITRILKHLKQEGWIKKGNTVLDPFGGVGTAGVMCARAGYKWVGVELEKHFHLLAEENFELHRPKWEHLGLPVPQILLGDSRKMNELLRGKSDLVFSGPPSGPLIKDNGKNEGSGGHGEEERRGRHIKASSLPGYSPDTPGQMGNLEFGRVDSVLSSPPYADVSLAQNSEDERKVERLRKVGHSEKEIKHILSNAMIQEYGETRGQLSRMKQGKVEDEAGKDKEPTTFWEAARDIVQQCFQVLKPGGHAVWVVKNFVRNKQVVPFSEDWLKLCVSCGFTPTCRHQAMLVKTYTQPTFDGDVEKERDRKSFFKRLTESKGSPRIDWEDVICVEKPLNSR